MGAVLAPLLLVSILSSLATEPSGHPWLLRGVGPGGGWEITVLVDYFDKTDTALLQAALKTFVRDVPEDNRIGVMSLGEDPPAASDYTSDRRLLMDAVDRLSPLSDLQLWHRFVFGAPASAGANHDVDGSIADLLAAFAGRPVAPRAVVVVASEQVLRCPPTVTAATFNSARDHGVRVDVVRVRADLRPGMPDVALGVDPVLDRILRTGTHLTGGRDELASSTRDLEGALTRIAKDLGHR